MAKLVAVDTAMRVTADSAQVLGGVGRYTRPRLSPMTREATVPQLAAGTSQILRVIIGRYPRDHD